MSLKPKSVVQNAKGALQKPQRAMHGTQSAEFCSQNNPCCLVGPIFRNGATAKKTSPQTDLFGNTQSGYSGL